MDKLFDSIPKLNKIILKSILMTRWISLFIDLLLPIIILIIVRTFSVPLLSWGPILLIIWIATGTYDLNCLLMSVISIYRYKKTYNKYMLPLHKFGRKKLLLEVIRTGTPLLYIQDINFSNPSFKDYVGLALGISNKNKYWWLIFIPLFSSINFLFWWGNYEGIQKSKLHKNERYNVVAYKSFILPKDMKEMTDDVIRGEEWLNGGH